jgi:hypothetical protein
MNFLKYTFCWFIWLFLQLTKTFFMTKNYMNTKILQGLLLVMSHFFAIDLRSQIIVQTYTFTGAIQTFVVPGCVSTITVDVRGAEGGDVNAVTAGFAAGTASISGGDGGRVVATITVAAGNVLNFFVGGKGSLTAGGYNGGGSPGACSGTEVYGAGGGGASDIRRNGISLINRVVVAGGGGGASGSGSTLYQSTNNTGAGGGLTGGNATNSQSTGFQCINGLGGTQTAGGAGGNNSCYCNLTGVAPSGSLGIGGSVICAPSGLSTCSCNGTGCTSGGGGGGGFYGGGAGIAIAAGGGGSSYTEPSATGVTHTQGFQTGNGTITFSYTFNGNTVNASASPTVICAGGTTTLNANTGLVTYTWNTGSNTTSIAVSPSVNTTYTLLGTNAQGCISTATIAVPVNGSVPTLSVSNSQTVLCAGKPTLITATGATTYSWAGGAITNGVPYIPLTTSDYTVTGGNACGTSSAVTSVTVLPLPNVTASVNNPTVCNGSSVTLNGGGSVSGYTWAPVVPNNTAFVPPTSTNYTVTGIAANGCTASAVAGVTVLVTPNIPPVVTPTSVCLGTNATLTAIGATGYTWTPGLGLNSFSAAVSPPGSTTYTLFRSNGACTSTATINLVINPLPFANATASPSLICAGDAVALNVIGGITYTWLPGGFTTANFTFYPNSSGSYTATSSNGSCTATGVVQVSVNPSPVVGINTSTSTVCAGGNVTLTATGNAATYTWLPGNSNATSIVVNPTAVSQYTLIGNNTANCTNRQTQLILVNAVPPLVLNSSVPFVCTGTTAILSIANATVPGVTYSWSSNSGSGSTTNVSPTVTTTYFASAVTNSTGCSSSGSLPLTVNISTFVVASPSAICRGNSATIVASGAANSYNWSVNGVGVGNTASITVSPTLTTNYVVLGTTGGCSNSNTVQLIVNLLPNVVAAAVKPQICRLENGTLTATGANSYTWNTNANTQSIIINSLTVTSSFTVTGTDLNNCVKSSTVTQFVATCLGIEFNGEKQDLGLSIYPNPNQGNFTISSEVDVNISVVNALGQLLYNTQVSKDQQKNLTLSNLPNGIYFILAENNGVKVSKKIVIEK